jgi:hypothetical protein
MKQCFNTFELASVYESQGYFQDALEMYQAMEKESQGRDPELNAAVSRMELAIQNQPKEFDKALEQNLEQNLSTMPEKRIERLLEQWLMLMVLQKRLNVFKRIKTRL